jgi:hypothetical protein
MSRPRLMGSSRASSENAPERQRCQCVFESNAAMTAPMVTKMHVCHHAASLGFAVARKGRAPLRRGPLLVAGSLARRETDGPQATKISTSMKGSAKFIVPSLYLRWVARLLLKDGQTPLKERKAVSNVHLTENTVSAVGAAICRADAPGEGRGCSSHHDTATMWPVPLMFCSL